MVHEYDTTSGTHTQGIAECTVSIPLKPPILATIKTTNYLVNALAAMEAAANGGTLGLQLDSDGNVAECSIGSVGFLGPDGILRTPPMDKILRSTTLIRAFELWKQADTPILDFVFEPIKHSEIGNAVEIIAFGGGVVRPIIKMDGKQVGDGKPGPVFAALNRALEKDAVDGPYADQVSYD